MEKAIKRKQKEKKKVEDKLEVPQEEVETILKEFHDTPLGGHVGSRRMRKRIAAAYYWKHMRRDIEDFVRRCDSCQKNKICKVNRMKIPNKLTL